MDGVVLQYTSDEESDSEVELRPSYDTCPEDVKLVVRYHTVPY
jgi:hypothetical protein